MGIRVLRCRKFVLKMAWLGVLIAGAVSSSASASSCQKLLSRAGGSSWLADRNFVAHVRGEPLVVRYQVNTSRFDLKKPVYVVLPGLNMPSLTEKLAELGSRGVQAVSLDLLNIKDVGPIARPTPDEDAQVVADLLVHLKFDRTQIPLVVVGHSRGALIANRLMVTHLESFRWVGAVQINPYVGWIPHYYADKQAGQVSQWVKSSKGLIHPYLSMTHFWVDWMADWAQATGQWMNRSALEALMNLHAPASARRALGDVLGESDEATLERIRQKLLGMENSEVVTDLEVLAREGVPVVFILSDQDEFVPFEMAENVRKQFGLSGWVFEGAGHYLPYQRTGEVTDIILEVSRAWLGSKTSE